MDCRIDFITLGVEDLEETRRFYLDGLGWQPYLDIPGEIAFVQAGHGLTLSFYAREKLDADSDQPGSSQPASISCPFTLSHNVGGPDEVIAVTEQLRAAGGTVLKEPQRADFGGFHAYVTDPSGYRWEICHNPGWHVGPDGTVSMGDPA